MKWVLVVLGALLLPGGGLVTAAGVPLFGFQDAKVLAGRPDAGSERRHVIGHVQAIHRTSDVLDELDLDDNVRIALKLPTAGTSLIELKEAPGIYVYVDAVHVAPGDRVAVSGHVYQMAGKGVVIGNNAIAALLSGGIPQPAEVRTPPFWYLWLGVALAVMGLVLLVLGVRMKRAAPDRRPPAEAPAAGGAPVPALPPGAALPGPPQPPTEATLPPCPSCGHPMGWAPQRGLWICPACRYAGPPPAGPA